MIINSVICIKGSLGKASQFVTGLYYFYCCRDMAYRPNFGGGYEPSYNSPNALGFSNVSRNLKQASFRSRIFLTQTITLRTMAAWERLSLCSRMRDISSDKPNKSWRQTSITSGSAESSLKTNLLSLRTNSVGRK